MTTSGLGCRGLGGRAVGGRAVGGRAVGGLFVAACIGACAGAVAEAQQSTVTTSQGTAPAGSAEALVRQALHSRALGGDDSADFLARARSIDPRSDPAHWHSGYVRDAGGWLKYDAVADGDAYRRLLDRYETERLAHPDTLAGHTAMAGWCREQKLPMQERAHWFKVLEIDADHAAARARLGFVRVGGKWITRSEVENTRQRKIGTEQAFKKWSAALRPIRIGFESGDPQRIAAAREKLSQIRDPDAIPAMEAMLSRLNLDAASAVVFTIRQMPGPDAAVGLARHAVFADWFPVGKQAAEALRDYDEVSYMPLLLSGLSTLPGEAFKMTSLPGADPGRLLVRYEYQRERQEGTQKVTHDVSYGIWTGSSVADVDDSAAGRHYGELLKARIERDQATVAGRLEEESRATKQLNEQICRALRTATQQDEVNANSDDPRTWWDWWSTRREIVLAGRKPVSIAQYATEEYEVAGRYQRPLVLATVPEPPPPPPRPPHSCLVAGTMIRTDVGLRPVEQIRLGDRVLSQNVDTGELAYRAVLQPTRRESAPTMFLKLGEFEIRSTMGHPFWVAGSGWIMAKNIEPGMRLAAVDGAAEVTGTEKAADTTVYNLVIDEFHTYFVGDRMILSHDVRQPEPTHGRMPGERFEDGK
jgi:hypothetical protein